jgi:putative PIN family toxin of toxin-antitoxin system
MIVRAVLDFNVIISAVLSAEASPARILRAWVHGQFELVVSPLLLEELHRAFGYRKLRKRIEPEEAEEIVKWLRRTATMAPDPHELPTIRSSDPGDDYLIALAQAERGALVSGDQHVLDVAEHLPVFSPADFLRLLESESLTWHPVFAVTPRE